MTTKKPFVLCILDGWGEGPEGPHNAISRAKTPVWDRLRKTVPFTTLKTSGEAVGLPPGQMGNSEVGHMTLGAGRVCLQSLPEMTAAFETSEVFLRPAMKALVSTLQGSGRACHVMGLLSSGGVHAHIEHILGMAIFLSQFGIPVWIHGFLDGRDTPPGSAADFIAQVEAVRREHPLIRWGTLGGRYYAMDRDNRWERTQKAWEQIVCPQNHMSDPWSELEGHAREGVTDEFILPRAMQGYEGTAPGDALLMMNFRTDRIQQILNALLNPTFSAFSRGLFAPDVFSMALSLTPISSELRRWVQHIYESVSPAHTLGEVLSRAGLRQLRLAETEKYAHVTFFFNGGREEPLRGEDRILVPSPSVPTYDQCPEMAAFEITQQLVQALKEGRHDFILVNYANADMVGHTGNWEATIQAIEAVDACLGQVAAAVAQCGGVLLITADHGNAEQMMQKGSDNISFVPHTAHTCYDVPCVFVGSCDNILASQGALQDVAPTILSWFELEVPYEMTGLSLLDPGRR